MLCYHLTLCTQSSYAGGASRHLFHTWRELNVLMWSFQGGRAEHESAELLLQASLQSKVVSVMKEKCSEARERGSANSAAKERPFDLVWHLLVPPHSMELSPSAICSPYPLINFSTHRQHCRIHNAQKAVVSLYLVLLLASRELSIFDRPPEIGQDHKFSSILSQTAISSAEFTSPILLASACSHSSTVPFSSKTLFKNIVCEKCDHRSARRPHTDCAHKCRHSFW